ncbi:hypothetical protein Acr_01g0001090 [Actinidia rufa]|uniref:Uncharacterized protein n=1 Tax=Actinidia rufa TaxID=165716 RepID=A0A7J0E1M1_9ERIC|nr:hypothetical protein Acr_01g0001090 [Actinidia rufa]
MSARRRPWRDCLPPPSHHPWPIGAPARPVDGSQSKEEAFRSQIDPHRCRIEPRQEDLWQQVFPVGTEWDQLDLVYQYKWNFSNLENAFEEGGELHGQNVYLFGCTEPQLVFFKGEGKVTCIPVVVAVVSPFPPSDKIGINSVQREAEEIVPMKQMKMDWVPYIPLENRAGLRHMKIDRVKKFEYCLPYFYQPLQEDELEQSTIVQILFPAEPPVFCEFDWELDELEEFADNLVKEDLAEDQKDAFKDFVKEKVREGKKANREAREARKKALQEMSEETKAAFQNMKFYKFYPVPTPDTPDVSNVKIGDLATMGLPFCNPPCLLAEPPLHLPQPLVFLSQPPCLLSPVVHDQQRVDSQKTMSELAISTVVGTLTVADRARTLSPFRCTVIAIWVYLSQSTHRYCSFYPIPFLPLLLLCQFNLLIYQII